MNRSKLKRIKTRFRQYFSRDATLFILQFLRHPSDIGAIAPSSVQLAEAMTRYVGKGSEKAGGKKYLEVGAGTGSFTKKIIYHLSPTDQLDIIEINPKFGDRLKEKYSQNENVSIYVGSILDWNPNYKYDGIISSLPFNAFKATFVNEILKHYAQMTKPGGHVSYFEYMALPGIRKMFKTPRARKILQNTLDVTKQFETSYQVRLEKVFANFPPALVHHCQLPGA